MSDLNGILPLIRESNSTNLTATWQPKAGLNGVERLTTIAFHDEEIIPNLAFHACDESCQHEDIQKLVERNENAAGTESSSHTIALKIRPDGSWERRQHEQTALDSRIGKATYDQLLYKAPEVELFNAGEQTNSKSLAIPTIPPSRICNHCTCFGFGMICGGVLTLKSECQSEEDRARWAAEARDRNGFEEQAIQPSYAKLAESARSCASCLLFHACLPDPTSYIIDETRPVTIRAGLAISKDKQRDLSNLKVGLPIKDSNYPAEAVSVYGQVGIYGSHDSLITDPVIGVSGRPINPADDVEQPFRWFQECLDNHEACGKAAREGSDGNVTLPTRLVHVPTAESENPRLVATSGQKGRYLALSYRWGTATITKTLKDNLDTHSKSIPALTLSKTFQDALTITRRLGFQYIWIDSLCIIQDSPQDWAREAMQMSSIYTNAAMTISASVSDSADSGLFYPHTVDYSPKLTLRSIGGTAVADFFLTARSLSSFEDDVKKGTLSNRGWCLQERLLSRRILHFGTTQLHWECLSGVWSASSAKNLTDNPSRTLNNRFLGASSLPLAIPKEIPTLFAELRQVYAHQPHGTWYHMLRDYTSRSLTDSSDKLPALAGLAAAFAEKTKDVYLNGLWMHGLPEGLLWSSPGLGFNDLDSKSNLSAPNGHRAPTWSWASLDGEIEYPIGRLGYIDAELEGFTAPTRAEEGRVLHYEEHENRLFSDPDQVLIMKGKLKPLSKLRGFRAEDREVVEQAKDLNITCRMPHLRFDDPERDRWDVQEVFALFIGQVGCGNNECEHASDCSYGWGYGLLIEPLPIFTACMQCCARVGVMQCYSGDFNDCEDRRFGLK